MAEGIEEVKVVGEPPMGVVTNNFNKENWVPKTELGFKVKSGEIKDINDIAGKGLKFLEPQIVDMLLPNLESSLLSIGQSKETMPAREKALRNAKLNIISIRRGGGSWECGCRNVHSIPFKVKGKCSSVEIELIPAPLGTGLCIEEECKKILEVAGIKDVYSRAVNSKNRLNLMYACLDALKELSRTKVSENDVKNLGIVRGIQE